MAFKNSFEHNLTTNTRIHVFLLMWHLYLSSFMIHKHMNVYTLFPIISRNYFHIRSTKYDSWMVSIYGIACNVLIANYVEHEHEHAEEALKWFISMYHGIHWLQDTLNMDLFVKFSNVFTKWSWRRLFQML